jgi:hypothetical protein
VPRQIRALVADQYLNHCDHLAARDELGLDAQSANYSYRRGATNRSRRVEAMNPTSLGDFAHQLGQTQSKFVLHVLDGQLAVAQMQVQPDE